MTATMKKMTAMLVALALACTLAPSLAFAASKATVKTQDFTTTTSVIKKKAASVKKGTTTITLKKNQGYVKFKAPKTKQYKFTFSNVKTKGYTSNAYVAIQKPDSASPKYSFMIKASTKGGKSETLWLSANGYASVDKGVDRTLKSRTATMKLNKGEQVFFYMYTGQAGKATAKLVIK